MIRVLFFSLLLFESLFGYSYDDLLLRAQSAIYPKIVVLDKKVSSKLVDDKILFTVVYCKEDHESALFVKQYIQNKYKDGVGKYPISVDLVEFSQLSKETGASALYVLYGSKNDIKKAAEIARQKRVISFSYNLENLKYGLLFAAVIEKTTTLYLNKEYKNIKSIELADFLLQSVKFIDKSAF